MAAIHGFACDECEEVFPTDYPDPGYSHDRLMADVAARWTPRQYDDGQGGTITGFICDDCATRH